MYIIASFLDILSVDHFKWISVATAAVSGLIYLYNKIMKPMIEFGVKMDQLNEYLPTLIELAADFKNNGGSSLKDKIDNMDHTLNLLGSQMLKVTNLASVKRDLISLQISDIKKTLTQYGESSDQGGIDANLGIGEIQTQLDVLIKQLETLSSHS